MKELEIIERLHGMHPDNPSCHQVRAYFIRDLRRIRQPKLDGSVPGPVYLPVIISNYPPDIHLVGIAEQFGKKQTLLGLSLRDLNTVVIGNDS